MSIPTRSVGPPGPPRFWGEDVPEVAYADARAVVLGAPLEATVCYGGGTRRGPAAILEASTQMEVFDEKTWRPFGTGGVHTLGLLEMPADPEAAVGVIGTAVGRVVGDGKFALTLGGEHTVTVGAVRGVVDARGAEGLCVLQVDAHADLRDEYQGSPWSHACAMRRVRDMGVAVVGCGIRSVSPGEAAWLDERGERSSLVLDHERDAEGRWIDDAIARLTDTVYLTIDIDGLDPALCPGTGTPEPGGLSFRETEALIEALAASGRKVVGADLCEVAPIEGQTTTEFTAARLAARILQVLAA